MHPVPVSVGFGNLIFVWWENTERAPNWFHPYSGAIHFEHISVLTSFIFIWHIKVNTLKNILLKPRVFHTLRFYTFWCQEMMVYFLTHKNMPQKKFNNGNFKNFGFTVISPNGLLSILLNAFSIVEYSISLSDILLKLLVWATLSSKQPISNKPCKGPNFQRIFNNF